MEFSIKLDTFKSGWSIVYIESSRVVILNEIVFLSLKIYFVLTNRADTDKMQRSAAFHLGLHCSPKYPFTGSQAANLNTNGFFLWFDTINLGQSIVHI